MVALRETERFAEERPNIPVWVVVFDKNLERVLLVREKADRKKGQVGLPGGRPKNPFEPQTQAGIRELREETGLVSQNLISYPNNVYIDYHQGRERYFAGRAYIATDIQGQLQRETKETKTFWARVDKLDRYGSKLGPSVKAVITDALNFLNSR